MLRDLLGDDDTRDQLEQLLDSGNSGSSGSSRKGENNLNSLLNPQNLDKIRKIMDMMEGMRGDSRVALLHSLKPHLNQNRQSKIDKAVEFISLSQVLRAMRDQNKKGD